MHRKERKCLHSTFLFLSRSRLGLQLSWSRNQETATAQLNALGSQEWPHDTHDGNTKVTGGKSDGWAARWHQRRLHVLKNIVGCCKGCVFSHCSPAPGTPCL